MSKRCITLAPVRCEASRWPQLAGVGGACAVATMTLVTAVSYACVAAAPLGLDASAAAVLSGLIGAAIGGAVAAAFSAAPGLVFSPRASVAVVIAAALTAQGASTGGVATLAWLSACLALAALLQALFALLKLGALIRLVPHSVTAGFTIGIAAEMAWSQLPHLFAGGPATDLTWAAPLVIGGATIAGVAWARWKGLAAWALVAGMLLGVVAHAALAAAWPALALPHLQPVHLDAAPLISVPALVRGLIVGPGLQHWPSLFAFALIIAFVNSIETLSSTVVVEELTHRRLDADRALMAGALGSIAAVCAGGLPVAGSCATSVVNVEASGDSRHSSLVAAGVVGVLALLVGNLLSAVPLAVVAGLLLTVASTLANEPLRELARARQGPTGPQRASGLLTGDIVVATIVFTLLLTTGLFTAIVGGVMAAGVLIVRQMRLTLVRRQYDANHPDAAVHLSLPIEPALGRCIRVIEVAQPVFFATADAVVEVLERLRLYTRFAILDLTQVGAVDGTASRVLARLSASLQQTDRALLVVPGPRFAALDAGGVSDSGCKLFASVGDALRFAAQQCEQRFVDESAALDLVLPLPDLPSPSLSWSRRLQIMVSPLRDVRHLITGVPEIHTPLDPQAVERVGRQLAIYIGAIGKVLARRAAPRCPDLAALYRTLAQELHSVTEREAFLRMQQIEPLPLVRARAPEPPATRSVALSPSPAGLSLEPALLEQATRDLKLYLGPIAKLLVKRAQEKAIDREHLYHLLARQLSTVADRDAFLSAAGIHPTSGDTF
jgi:sulfate permease, SulP family